MIKSYNNARDQILATTNGPTSELVPNCGHDLMSIMLANTVLESSCGILFV